LIRFFVIFFLLTTSAFSEIKKVSVTGNLRVSSNTIESLVNKNISNIDTIYINSLTKKIYDTDFFSDVKISYSQEILSIAVVENAIINFFYINGIKDDDLDKVNKIVSLKENTIFSNSKLKKDIENIKDYFRNLGHFAIVVNPDVIKIENNQINLILNIDKKEASKIKNIFFIGSKYFSNSQLLDVISSSEDGWWKLFSTTSLSEQRVDYDKQLLKDFYKSKGFYDAQIESAFANIDNNNNFSITFSINSGKKYSFGELEVKSNSNIYTEKDISEVKLISSKLIKDSFFSPQILSKIDKELTIYFESKKYNNFEINIQENKGSNDKINVMVQLNQSQNLFINRINIDGNSITEEKTIRDNLFIAEGDSLNLSQIKKSVDKLKSKQLFSKVSYKLEDADVNKKNYKDLNLTVKEQPTGNISAGVGYGTNGGLFQTSVNERNFLGKGINLNFTGTLATEKVSGEFLIVDPNFRNSDRELAYSLYSETDDYRNSGYQSKRTGNKLSTKYEIYEDVYFRPNVLLQYDKLEVNSGVSNLLKSRNGSYTTSAAGYNISVDSRDSKFSPTSGYVMYLEQNFATLISDVPTIQTGVGSTFYKELINQDYIGSAKIRLDSAVGLNNKDIKLSDRLFASSSDLRGFQPRGVGPVDTSDHVGGNYLATLSLKSTFPNPIPESLRANSYFFIDAGNIWGIDYSDSISDSSKVRSSTGLSLDIISPIGPLSFTYAIPLSKASTDKDQRFTFNIGSSF